MGQLATGYRQTTPSPIQYMDLPLRGQYVTARLVQHPYLTRTAVGRVPGELWMDRVNPDIFQKNR